MEWISGNIFIRPMRLDTGGKIEPHTHNFDHTTIVLKGCWKVTAVLPDGRRIEREFATGSHALIKAGVEHGLEALEDGSEAWCVYAHRTPQGDVTQEFTGWHEAYL